MCEGDHVVAALLCTSRQASHHQQKHLYCTKKCLEAAAGAESATDTAIAGRGVGATAEAGVEAGTVDAGAAGAAAETGVDMNAIAAEGIAVGTVEAGAEAGSAATRGVSAVATTSQLLLSEQPCLLAIKQLNLHAVLLSMPLYPH